MTLDKKFTQDVIQQIKDFKIEDAVEEVGTVSYVGDGIAFSSGLDKAMYGEMVEFDDGTIGMVQNLEEDQVGIIIFGSYHQIHEGDLIRRLNRTMEVPVGTQLLGRVVDALGRPIDDKGPINNEKFRPIEIEAPGIMERESVNEPLQTGIKAIDSLVPIGRGQRELIIGDRKTGKTALAIDTILNQKDQDVICFYVAIGQKESTVKNIVQTLQNHDALKYSVVMTASASKPAPLLFVAPYAATAMAEEFMYQGKDVLIIYDDLSKQAAAYREMSLLLKRPPGREAYPGDIFYLHSRLLERSAKLSKELGGGSITSLPIVETQAGDISAYIPTNVISITDGQIFLQSDLFFSGVRPAINAGLSVSRVGGAAQLKAMKQVSGTLRLDLASYRELEAFTSFGSDIDEMTARQLRRGRKIVEILKQPLHRPLRAGVQIITFYALGHGFFDDIPLNLISKYEQQLTEFLSINYSQILKDLESNRPLPTELELHNILDKFTTNFNLTYQPELASGSDH
ncbi:F0F1 ATP synthase subunit alpha [Facklamia sp. DSM 111018]|uniref:ATP synthase subunit alpha n=1 Tax=Facklamia lactis TaxID=2749967 RepID=A0ABS0LPU7_9LACT|nr:F0F1 ATP synthase subunit alpha [Facklamia lactis]MBG9979924.1 F0F1 ATP synthase subunit alpha [Facklamia lactis]MBG9985396.1 F0F1 ATP synthase subunit alpha [Facklamia lactis]